MYGKLFESTFSGSMYGKGSTVFAVWGYAIAHARKDGSTEMNPKMLASVLGDSLENVSNALAFLEAPDPESRSKNDEGKRLIKEGEYLYRIVNYQRYNGMRNEDERREYNRQKQKEHRQRVSNGLSNSVSHGQPPSASVSGSVPLSITVSNPKNQSAPASAIKAPGAQEGEQTAKPILVGGKVYTPADLKRMRADVPPGAPRFSKP